MSNNEAPERIEKAIDYLLNAIDWIDGEQPCRDGIIELLRDQKARIAELEAERDALKRDYDALSAWALEVELTHGIVR